MLFLFNQPQCRQESLLCRVTNKAYGDKVLNQFNPTMKHPMFLNSLAPTSKMLVICKSNFSTSLTSFAKGVDFNPRTMEDLIEGLRDKIQSNSTRVKPYLANEAESVPKGTIQNFELYETAVPPTGKEFVFLKGSKSFHISNPLNLTELELLNEIKTFLSFLDEDKNYSIHVIANYPEERLGYRSISKSFLISSKVPAVKLRDYLLSALKSQLDRYKVEDVLYLVLQYKECSLVKERGPLRDILNLSSEVLREYGYDWAERLKDKALYPLTTMYHIELLLRESQTTRSQSKLFEIKESLEKYATDLNETFLGKPRAYDISLERVRSQSNIPEIVDELKKLFIEKDQERQLSTQKFVTSIKSQMGKLISKLDVRDAELRRRDEELRRRDEEFRRRDEEFRRREEEFRRRNEERNNEVKQIRRDHAEEIKMVMSSRRTVVKPPVKETSDLTIQTMPERNIGKIFYDMEMQIWNDNSNAVKMYDVYVSH
jgi:Skp family chaperone for outer membrane proteins